MATLKQCDRCLKTGVVSFIESIVTVVDKESRDTREWELCTPCTNEVTNLLTTRTAELARKQ